MFPGISLVFLRWVPKSIAKLDVGPLPDLLPLDPPLPNAT